MTEPDNMVLPLLREMRAENLGEHKRTREQVSLLERRMAKLEEMQALENRMTAMERH